MQPSLIDIVPDAAFKKPNNLDQMRARHTRFIDGITLANPAIVWQIKFDFEVIISIVFGVGNFYGYRACNLQILLHGNLVIFTNLVISQVFNKFIQCQKLGVLYVRQQLIIGYAQSLHVIYQPFFDPQNKEYQFAQIRLMGHRPFNKIVHRLCPSGRDTEPEKAAGHLAKAVLLLLPQKFQHYLFFPQKRCDLIDNIFVNLLRWFFHAFAEQRIDDIFVVLSSYPSLQGLHFMEPIQQMIIRIAILSLQGLQRSYQGLLVVCQNGFRNAIAHALKEEREQSFKVFSVLSGNSTHSKQSYSCILILSNEEAHPQVFHLPLFSFEQLISDVEAQQISIPFIVFLHCLAAQEKYSIFEIPPESNVSLGQFLQQVIVIIESPKQFTFYVLGLLFRQFKLIFYALDVMFNVIFSREIHEILPNLLRLSLSGRKFQLMAMFINNFLQVEEPSPLPVLQDRITGSPRAVKDNVMLLIFGNSLALIKLALKVAD